MIVQFFVLEWSYWLDVLPIIQGFSLRPIVIKMTRLHFACLLRILLILNAGDGVSIQAVVFVVEQADGLNRINSI